MKDELRQQKTFLAKLENLPAMIEFILDQVRGQGADKKMAGSLRLASEEALINIINHAYPGKEGNLTIVYKIEEDKGLVIEVIDWGIPFNPLSRAEPDLDIPIEKRPVGGLGISIIRKIMDEVKYKRDQERNILTMIKHSLVS